MQNSLLSFISSLIINKDEQKLLDDQHKATQVFKNITKNFSLTKALKASQADRECLNLTSNSYKYGEIVKQNLQSRKDFNSLHQALVVAKPAEGGIFYDLGSGIGKGVIAASLLHKFNICKGIEQLGTLFELSQELGINFKQQENSVKQEMLSLDIDWELPQIEFIHSDFLKYDWSDGTFIYASTTCYDAGLMRNISKKAKELKSGAIFVTLTKQLEPTDEWKLIDKIRVNVSWGASTMYVQRKI